MLTMSTRVSRANLVVMVGTVGYGRLVGCISGSHRDGSPDEPGRLWRPTAAPAGHPGLARRAQHLSRLARGGGRAPSRRGGAVPAVSSRRTTPREASMSSFWPSNEDLAAIDEQPDYLNTLKGLVNLFDRAMSDEGIDPAVRDRVVARVLHGEPTPGATRDWAEPLARDLAVIDALADAAPTCVRTRPTWTINPANGGGS